MTTVAIVVLLVLLIALSVFQLGLALGAPWGRFAWGGQHTVLPSRLRIGSVVSIAIYGAIMVIAAERVGAINVLAGSAVEGVAMWVIAVYFALGIILNGISRSKPERYTMTPVVAFLAIASLIIALS